MDWRARVLSAFDGITPPADDVLDELADHLRALHEHSLNRGLTRAESDDKVEAQLALWRQAGPTLHRRAMRRLAEPPPPSSGSPLVGLWQDARYVGRILLRQPRPSLIVVATMALGIATITTLFSVTYGVLLRPLPWPNADRLITVEETRGGRESRFGPVVTNAAVLAWQEDASTIERLAAWSSSNATLSVGEDAERAGVVSATSDLFPALGVRPIAGSFFGPKDESSPVVVISEQIWRRWFGGDPGAIGRSLRVDGQSFTVVGVLADAQAFPNRQTMAWTPFHVEPVVGNSLSMFQAVGLLRPGVTPAQAAAEGTARGRFVPDTGMTTMAVFGGTGVVAILAVRLRDTITGDVGRALIVLFAAGALLLVIATSNVAGLQLARATARRREMAIRAAIGASTARVARQLLLENLALAAIGGLVGIGLALLVQLALPSLLPADFPRAAELAVDGPVLLFALALSALAGIVCGTLPALRTRRLNLVASLVEGGNAPVGVGRRSRAGRMRRSILAAQFAVTCILLVGASLLGRTYWDIVHVDRGYDSSHLITATLPMPASQFTDRERYDLAHAILDRTASTMRDVLAAAFTSDLPISSGSSWRAFTMYSPVLAATVSAQASPRVVSPGYFAAMGQRVVSGRAFLESDTVTSEPVAIVNRAFAREYLGQSAVGAVLPLNVGSSDEPRDGRVIGVVDDVRYAASGDTTQPELYLCACQLPHRLDAPTLTFVARTSGAPDASSGALRDAIRGVDGRLTPSRITTMDSRLSSTFARPRLYAVLIVGFAGCALAVAAVGLFAGLSYSVAQRRRELAVRAALGATRSELIGLVVRQGLVVAGIGLGLGLLAAAMLAPGVRSLLSGVAPIDPLTFGGVPLVLLAIAALASLAPALRAARFDPASELRT